MAFAPRIAGVTALVLATACSDDASTSSGSGGASASSTSTGAGGGTTQGSGGATTTASSTTTSGTTTTTVTSATTTGAGGGACDTVAVFDGTNDVIKVAVGGALDSPDDFSVSASVRPEPMAAGSVSFVAGRHLDGASNGYYLALTSDANGLALRFNVFTGNATCSATAPLTLPASGMVHVAGSWKSPDVRLFVDGVPVKTEPCGSFTSFIEPTSVFSIGRSDTGALPFQGRIDDVRYGVGAFTSTFDPAALSCGAGGELLIDFQGVAPGESTAVPETCAVVAADGVVGTAAGADAADPAFLCD